MKSYSSLIHEFTVWKRREIETLFIVLDWVRNYHTKHPNESIGKEWLNATELTIKIIYDDAFSAVKNRGVAYFSGCDITEAPPEIIRSVVEELERFTSPCSIRNEVTNTKPSTSSVSCDTDNDVVNIMFFGPAYRIRENNLGNSSTQDIPFGFQFPNTMQFNFEDKKQDSSYVTRENSASTLSFPSSIFINEAEQKETFLPLPTKIYSPSTENENSFQTQESMKPEVTEIYESSHLDLTKYFNSSADSQNSNPAIEFFRISSGFLPPPKNSDIAKMQCTSPFCLCASVKAAYKNERNEENSDDDVDVDADDDDDISVPIEPYLEVENTNFPKLELPDLFDDTHDSFVLQPFNTPNATRDLDTSSEYIENVKEVTISLPGTPISNSEDKELMLQPFNTPVTPANMSSSSNLDISLSSSLGVADLDLDEDITTVLNRKYSIDYDQEYIQQERLRILSSYEKSRVQMEQKKTDENEADSDENQNFATSTPNWRCSGSSKDKYRSRDY